LQQAERNFKKRTNQIIGYKAYKYRGLRIISNFNRRVKYEGGNCHQYGNAIRDTGLALRFSQVPLRRAKIRALS